MDIHSDLPAGRLWVETTQSRCEKAAIRDDFLAGDDSIPAIGASGCHRLQWPNTCHVVS